MKNLIGVLWLSVLAGCSTTPNYDAKFGDAVREARMKMTLNPEAANDNVDIAGMDGKASKEAITRYQGTFKAPPPVTNVINIGGSISSAK